MGTFREASTIIYTEDLGASLSFYRDLLGFEETYRFPEGDDAEFVALSLGGSAGAGMALAAVTDGQTGAHGQTIRPRAGRQFELCVYTDDVDRAIDGLRSRNVPVLAEPVDQPWGERMAYVADPSGNPVMVCAALGNGQAP
jgi:lactoylglutathione lyase